ncbi:GDSL-type esterase/lipase family protein [Streptomyces sp. NPDC059900]|uniref:GDSL-type esterase/lipase family protein n=1 Tax=Streptomyces sp. NPDC059900 TaxID=3155816 RepID=UPI0034220449
MRGAAWWTPDGRVLRADPADRERLPGDTWERAGLPAGVRLEFTARGVSAVEVAYTASSPSATDSYRDAPAVFTLLAGEDAADTPAAPGEHRTLVPLPSPDGEFTLHLPESLRPVLHGLRPVDGTLTPAAPRPRWLVYGDSIAEGWSVSRPHLAWPALAGRALGVQTVNLGYAGAARGELASAEQLASLEADLLTVAFGTNCWSRTPHSAGLLYETARAFLGLVRRGHPQAPLLVVSPVVRPDAESAPNALGATLEELRTAVERAAVDAGADLLPGGGLLHAGHLVDGVHPGDAGHGILAEAVASALHEELRRGHFPAASS